MADVQSSILALFQAELAEEAAAGFPRLKRIPCTDIIWFLDYYAALDTAGQQALLDELARFDAWWYSAPARPELPAETPARARMKADSQKPGGKCGTRYTNVKMLCTWDPSMHNPSHYDISWRQHFTPLHFQPRADLLPDINSFTSAKAPQLRKLVDDAFRRLFSPDKKRVQKEKLAGGACKYPGTVGSSQVSVMVDFGSIMGQVCYSVSVVNPAHTIRMARLAYEGLWGGVVGWDYLTEENAPRSIEFFAEQVVYLAHLVERVNAAAAGTP
jgi:hypothetical protein